MGARGVGYTPGLESGRLGLQAAGGDTPEASQFGGLTLAFDPLQLAVLEQVCQVSTVFSHSKCSSFFRLPRRCAHRYRRPTQHTVKEPVWERQPRRHGVLESNSVNSLSPLGICEGRPFAPSPMDIGAE